MDNQEKRSCRGHEYYLIRRNNILWGNSEEVEEKKVLKRLLAISRNPSIDIESLENSLSSLYSNFNSRTVYSYSFEEENYLLNLYYGYLE